MNFRNWLEAIEDEFSTMHDDEPIRRRGTSLTGKGTLNKPLRGLGDPNRLGDVIDPKSLTNDDLPTDDSEDDDDLPPRKVPEFKRLHTMGGLKDIPGINTSDYPPSEPRTGNDDDEFEDLASSDDKTLPDDDDLEDQLANQQQLNKNDVPPGIPGWRGDKGLDKNELKYGRRYGPLGTRSGTKHQSWKDAGIGRRPEQYRRA